MRTKSLALLVTVVLCTACCRPEKKPHETNLPDIPDWAPGYVIDTRLSRQHPERPPFNSIRPDNWIGEVCNSDIAYRLALPMIKKAYEGLGLDLAKIDTIGINLADNQYWLFHVSEKQDVGIGAKGRGFSFEMEKSNGMITKFFMGN